MARAMKVCSQPGCPQPTHERYCLTHKRQADQARGTTTQRGYGNTYQRERRKAKAKVNQGGVNCWRCGRPIPPDSYWHLGHDDHDRTIIRGPECAHCNLSAAGKARHQYQGR